MGDNSKISWTNATWNPVTGCTKVSAGCVNCYAERMAGRHMGEWKDRQFSDVRFHPERLDQPIRWKRPRRIFVNSMSDLFHPSIDIQQIKVIWQIMAQTPRHTFQVLTKREERMWLALEIFRKSGDFPAWPLPNVWLGVSVENQTMADRRIEALLETDAAIRWVSAEPLIGPLDLSKYMCQSYSGSPDMVWCLPEGDSAEKRWLDWVVVGGESGPEARPMHLLWAMNLLKQCRGYAVPFFFKQWGEWTPYRPVEEDCTPIKVVFDPALPHSSEITMWRVGKKAAGDLLNGKQYQEYPEAQNA